ncbi:MAG: CHRD domain-containing protein [Gemmatimonadota bacterium]|nr:CHRD domain-containing protein [Gemmatimonadota bacterium]
MKRFIVLAAAATSALLAANGCSDSTSPPRPATVVAVNTVRDTIVGQRVNDSLAVKVADSGGNPLSGITVTWAVTSGGGAVAPTTTTTNAAGIAKAAWTVGPTAGANTVTATVSGLAPVAFTVQARLETFSASLNGASENPPKTATGTGTASYTLNATGDTVSYTVTVSGLSGPPTGLHIHAPADSVTNAPVRVPLTITNPVITGTIATGKFTVTNIVNPSGVTPINSLAELLALMRNGQTYTNVHTALNPGGEIRGQNHQP